MFMLRSQRYLIYLSFLCLFKNEEVLFSVASCKMSLCHKLNNVLLFLGFNIGLLLCV